MSPGSEGGVAAASRTTPTLIRGASGSFLIKVASAGIVLVVHLVLARTMGADEYGVYVYVWTWITLGTLVGTLGFTASSVRFVAEYRGGGDWPRLAGFLRIAGKTVLLVSLVVSVLVIGVAWILVGGAAGPLFIPFVLGAVGLPFFAHLQLFGGILAGLHRVLHGQWPQYLLQPALVLVAFLVGVTWAGAAPTATAGLWATVVSCAVSGAVTWGLVRRHLPPQVSNAVPVHESRLWITTSGAMVLIAGFNLLLQRTDTLMVGASLGTTQAGVYAVASKVAGIMNFSPIAINAAFAPVAADLHARGERDELQRVVLLAARLGFGVALLMLAGLALAYRPALALFGPEFSAATGALWILALGQLFNAVAGPAIMVLSMTGHQNLTARILALGAVLNVLLNLVLVPRLGLEGGAVATTVALAAWNAMAVWAVWSRLGLGATAFSWSRRTTRDGG